MNLWDALRNSGKVIKEGLITPNEFNKPAADRFKASALPMLGVPGAVAETADELYKGNPGMAALAATGVVPGIGALGSIVRKGAPNILLSHTANPGELSSLLRYNSEKALTAPSLAVSKQVEPFGEGVMLYPYPQKLDPATNPRVDLYNTDIYAYRRRQGGHEAPYAIQQLRKSPKLTEGWEPSDPKLLSILASPRFSSLQEFEDSISGAHKLVPDGPGQIKGLSIDHSTSQQMLEQMLEWMAMKKPGYKPSYGTLERLTPESKRQLMQQFLAENPTAAALLNQAPQAYGEMKLHGKLPIDRTNIAAIGIPNPDMVTPRMVKELRKTGIPIVPRHLIKQDDIAGYVDQMTGLRERPASTFYNFNLEGPAQKAIDEADYWKI